MHKSRQTDRQARERKTTHCRAIGLWFLCLFVCVFARPEPFRLKHPGCLRACSDANVRAVGCMLLPIHAGSMPVLLFSLARARVCVRVFVFVCVCVCVFVCVRVFVGLTTAMSSACVICLTRLPLCCTSDVFRTRLSFRLPRVCALWHRCCAPTKQGITPHVSTQPRVHKGKRKHALA